MPFIFWSHYRHNGNKSTDLSFPVLEDKKVRGHGKGQNIELAFKELNQLQGQIEW